jgi:hypothetical protein
MFSFEKKGNQVIQNNHKCRRISLYSKVIIDIETLIMDTRKMGLISSTSITLSYAQTNVHKVMNVDKKTKIMNIIFFYDGLQ